MHFHPRITDSITGLNSFNSGISGASLKVSYALLKTYLNQHQKPKFIILNIDYFSLKNDTDRLNEFPRYFPYLTNDFLRTELNTIDDRFNSFYYNPLHSLPYSQIQYLSASLHGWLKIPGKYDTLMYKGFETNIPNKSFFREPTKPINSYISIKNRQYIDSLISLCKSKNIKLTLVTSPVFGNGNLDVLNKSALTKQLNNIAYINHIPYLNYTDSLEFNNSDLYSDQYHLNLSGALKFSLSFSKGFNNILIEKPLFNK